MAKVELENYESELDGGLGGGTFRIDEDNTAHLMRILRQFYQKPLLAVIREYTQNAQDEHDKYGNPNPVDVHIPSFADPEFRVRNYSPGVRFDDVMKIWLSFGCSTKRDDVGQRGCFGIGSKSAFAVSDSWSIRTWVDGYQYTYLAYLEETGKGRIDLVEKIESDLPEGTEIIVPIDLGKLNEFENLAKTFFRFFDPLPTGLPFSYERDTIFKGSNYVIYKGDGIGYDTGVYVRVGGACYGVINYKLPDKIRNYINSARNTVFVVDAELGEVDYLPTREGLDHTEKTDTFIDSLDDLFDQYRDSLVDRVSKETSIWSAYALLNEISSSGVKVGLIKWQHPEYEDMSITLDTNSYYRNIQCQYVYGASQEQELGFSLYVVQDRNTRNCTSTNLQIGHGKTPFKTLLIDDSSSKKKRGDGTVQTRARLFCSLNKIDISTSRCCIAHGDPVKIREWISKWELDGFDIHDVTDFVLPKPQAQVKTKSKRGLALYEYLLPVYDPSKRVSKKGKFEPVELDATELAAGGLYIPMKNKTHLFTNIIENMGVSKYIGDVYAGTEKDRNPYTWFISQVNTILGTADEYRVVGVTANQIAKLPSTWRSYYEWASDKALEINSVISSGGNQSVDDLIYHIKDDFSGSINSTLHLIFALYPEAVEGVADKETLPMLKRYLLDRYRENSVYLKNGLTVKSAVAILNSMLSDNNEDRVDTYELIRAKELQFKNNTARLYADLGRRYPLMFAVDAGAYHVEKHLRRTFAIEEYIRLVDKMYNDGVM